MGLTVNSFDASVSFGGKEINLRYRKLKTIVAFELELQQGKYPSIKPETVDDYKKWLRADEKWSKNGYTFKMAPGQSYSFTIQEIINALKKLVDDFNSSTQKPEEKVDPLNLPEDLGAGTGIKLLTTDTGATSIWSGVLITLSDFYLTRDPYLAFGIKLKIELTAAFYKVLIDKGYVTKGITDLVKLNSISSELAYFKVPSPEEINARKEALAQHNKDGDALKAALDAATKPAP